MYTIYNFFLVKCSAHFTMKFESWEKDRISEFFDKRKTNRRGENEEGTKNYEYCVHLDDMERRLQRNTFLNRKNETKSNESNERKKHHKNLEKCYWL